MTYFDVLERARKNGYQMSMGLELKLRETPKKGKEYLGHGAHLLPEMELDRLELFFCFFGEDLIDGQLDEAHSQYLSGDINSSIEYLKNYLETENANTKERGDDHSGQS